MKTESERESKNGSEKVLPSPEKSVAPVPPVSESTAAGEGISMKIILIILAVLLIICTITFGIKSTAVIDQTVLTDMTITQPFTETSEFDAGQLSNGLNFLITQTNDGIKDAYIALTVGVGSQTDPKDFIGFTHLIEHLLFTGSEKYPEDNYIEKIVNKYNGENNGVTKSYTTSYFYKTLVSFMEFYTGKKVYLKFNAFIENSLTYSDLARCYI